MKIRWRDLLRTQDDILTIVSAWPAAKDKIKTLADEDPDVSDVYVSADAIYRRISRTAGHMRPPGG